MELIDHYLSAVAGHLPSDTRDDIKEELRSSLYEQLEDQSKTLQRELTEEEQVEFLRKLGHPLKVAAQYLPQQYLIGPGLFPFYVNAMKTAAILVFVFHIAVSVVSALVTEDWIGSVSNIMSRIIGSMVVVGAIVTVFFAVMERSGDGASRLNRWDPLSLRKRGKSVLVNKSDMITDVSMETVMLLWWNGVFSFRDWISWNGSALSVATPGLDAVFWLVNIVLGGSLLLHGVMLIYTHWRPGLIAMEILLELATIGIMGYLLRFDNPVVVVPVESSLDSVQTGINLGFDILIWFIMVMTVVELIKHVRIAFRLARSAG